MLAHKVRSEADSFDYRLGQIAHQLRISLSDLDPAEKRLLEDYGRGASANGEARYRMVTFRRLCAIARRSRKPEVREALAELIRDEVFDGVAPTCQEVAFDQEAPVTGQCDVAQRQYELHPTPITRARCVEWLKRQIAVSRAALEAVIAREGTT